MTDIPIYGPLRSMTGEGKAAYASQIYDESLGKFQSEINQQGGASQNNSVFVAEYGVTSAADILSAISNGKSVVCFYLEHTYYLNDYRDGQPLYFTCFISSTARYFLTVNRDTSRWSSNNINHEITNNKKNTIAGNESSTTYYPTTKAVADYVDGIVGDIETLLASI